jgi:hypothetical protein
MVWWWGRRRRRRRGIRMYLIRPLVEGLGMQQQMVRMGCTAAATVSWNRAA